MKKENKQLNWAYMIAPQAGVAAMAYGDPGTGKTETIKALAGATSRLWILNSLDQKEPEAMGGFPKPSEITHRGRTYPVVKRIPEEDFVRAKLEPSVMLIDEFTCVSEEIQAAALGWMASPPENCWVFAAGNRIEQAANGNELTEPMINRMLIVDWEVDVDSWSEGMNNGGEFSPPEVPILPAGWQEFGKIYAVQIAEFVTGDTTHSRPDYLNKVNDPERMGLPFPSQRSWTNLAKVLGAADSVGANMDTKNKIAAGMVGEHIALEFMAFLELSEYKSPEEILANPTETEIPKQAHVALSYIRSVLRAVHRHTTADRWEAARVFLAYVHKKLPDVAKSLEAKLYQIKPDGHKPKKDELFSELEKERLG
tara:strand:- start:4133 stop:5236 length:1104 start_codon:yes stop_codon:yes gene_type:complete